MRLEYNEIFPNNKMDYNLAEYYKYPILITCAAYLPTLWLLQSYMQNRPPYKLKVISFTWNITLSILSFLGVIIILVSDYKSLLSFHVKLNDLSPWMYFVFNTFALTKIFEFGDTIILVLKKKPLMFLHVYHHFTVVLYCWISIRVESGYCHQLAFINLSIHSVMYLYYALTSIDRNNQLLKTTRPYITLCQTIQMFIGIFISWQSLEHPKCKDMIYISAIFSILLYGSYAYLFLLFYLKNYVKGIRPGMSLALGTVHICSIIGLKLALLHHRRWHILVDIVLGYASTYFIFGWICLPVIASLLSYEKDKNKTKKIKPPKYSSLKLSRYCLMLRNPWITWALEYQLLKKNTDIIIQKSSEKKIKINNDELSSSSFTRGLYLEPDKVITQEKSNLVIGSLGFHLATGATEDALLLIFSLVSGCVYSFYVYGNWTLGLFVHSSLRWMLEFYTTGPLVVSEIDSSINKSS